MPAERAAPLRAWLARFGRSAKQAHRSLALEIMALAAADAAAKKTAPASDLLAAVLGCGWQWWFFFGF